MLQIFTSPFFVTVISFLTAIVFTFAVRDFARRRGIVAAPKADRWHKKPTAMLGGTAIFLTTLLMYALFVPKTTGSLVILAGSSFLFLVGLVDDIKNIKPYQKLIGHKSVFCNGDKFFNSHRVHLCRARFCKAARYCCRSEG